LPGSREARAAENAGPADGHEAGAPAGEAGAPVKPADKAQRNFTDAESRIIKAKDGFIQGYNAQAGR